MRRALVLIAALLGLVSQPALAAARLERVVLLQRHGVRSPTRAPADLNPYAAQPWADWPVAPGQLTAHGAAALARMGEGLREVYAALLPGAGCARSAALFVWADNADQRTRESGQAMAGALAPGCGLQAAMAQGDDDPLFHGDALCRLDAEQAQAILTSRLQSAVARPDYKKARAALQTILAPDLDAGACAGAASKKCAIAADRNAIKDGKLSGTLADGATLSENLFLEYVQGMAQPGWGRVRDAQDLAAIMPLHDISSALTRRTPQIAARNATLLARQIESLLADGPAFRHQAPVPAQARVVLLLGHDTNISNIAGMLGLDWRLPGEPDLTAPDTALAFELWRDGARRFVRLRLYYQTADQLRTLTGFGPGRRVPRVALRLPGCGRDFCPLATVRAALEAHQVAQCLEP